MAFAHHLFKVIGVVHILLAFENQVDVLANEAGSAIQEKGNLPGLHLVFTIELSDTSKGAQIVGDREFGVMKDATDFGRRFALKSETYDLNPMGKYGPDVMLGSAKRHDGFGESASNLIQIARNGAGRDKEHTKREIFTGKQPTLAKCLLAKIGNAISPKGPGTGLTDDLVIVCPTMQMQADVPLLAIGDGLPGGFVGIDENERNPSWRHQWLMLIKCWKEDFFDDLVDGVGFKGRAIQPCADFRLKLILERLAL